MCNWNLLWNNLLRFARNDAAFHFNVHQFGTSGPTGFVVVACTSSSATSRGRLRNGECDVSIVNCSTPSRRLTVLASQRGID